MSLALGAYRALTTLAEPFAPLWLDRRVRRGKEERARLAERLARDDPSTRDGAGPPGRRVWLHGASVGEGLSLLPLVDALRATDPAAVILVTSGTVTSAELLAKRLPQGVPHRYAPLDLPGAARRFVDRWRPGVAVFVESEVWPNLLTALRREGTRTALLSARLSAASLRGWGRAPGAARALFGGFDLVMAQEDATARRLASLGARDDGRLNLKLAGAAPAFDPAALAAARAQAGGPVLLAASTHPGEEEIVLAAFRRLPPGAARLVIVPRHPERGEAVAALCRAGRRAAGHTLDRAPVHVADTLGELGLWYALADSTVIGGSLLPGPGGHNPLEPARLAAPALTGPHLDNWRDVFTALGETTPVVADAAALARAWTADLADPAAARRRGEAARARAEGLGGDLAAVAERLLAFAAARP